MKFSIVVFFIIVFCISYSLGENIDENPFVQKNRTKNAPNYNHHRNSNGKNPTGIGLVFAILIPVLFIVFCILIPICIVIVSLVIVCICVSRQKRREYQERQNNVDSNIIRV